MTKPLIKKSCYLPLNACIIAHVFLSSDGSLPSTIYDVFNMVVRIIISRHLEKLDQKCSLPLDEESYFEKLPLTFREHFKMLCKLAYSGVAHNQITFSDEELKSNGIASPDQRLGLLRGVVSFTIVKGALFFTLLSI